MSKIRSFREDPVWWEKLLVALAYLALGGLVAGTSPASAGGLLSNFMIIGILLWALVIRRKSIKYYVRYHTTQALVLNITLAALLWLLVAVIGVFMALPGLGLFINPLTALLFSPWHFGYGIPDASIKDFLVMSITLVMVFYALRGQYTRLPFVTDGVVHWL